MAFFLNVIRQMALYAIMVIQSPLLFAIHCNKV